MYYHNNNIEPSIHISTFSVQLYLCCGCKARSVLVHSVNKDLASQVTTVQWLGWRHIFIWIWFAVFFPWSSLVLGIFTFRTGHLISIHTLPVVCNTYCQGVCCPAMPHCGNSRLRYPCQIINPIIAMERPIMVPIKPKKPGLIGQLGCRQDVLILTCAGRLAGGITILRINWANSFISLNWTNHFTKIYK